MNDEVERLRASARRNARWVTTCFFVEVALFLVRPSFFLLGVMVFVLVAALLAVADFRRFDRGE